MANIHMLGRVFIRGDIHAATGLHIGAASAGLQIGGSDNPVVRDPVTGQPYIPGSSLKGKMRSLAERLRGFNPDDKDETQHIGRVRIHVCKNKDKYADCPVCPVFGLPGEQPHSTPTRLIVRDVRLDATSLRGAQLDFLSTEIKWEVSIDRITSAALPRQIERVPAGAIFKDCELVFSLYDLGQGHEREFDHLKTVFNAMQLLEDDYLGGSGSRGSGKVQFKNIALSFRKDGAEQPFETATLADLKAVIAQQDTIVNWVRRSLNGG